MLAGVYAVGNYGTDLSCRWAFRSHFLSVISGHFFAALFDCSCFRKLNTLNTENVAPIILYIMDNCSLYSAVDGYIIRGAHSRIHIPAVFFYQLCGASQAWYQFLFVEPIVGLPLYCQLVFLRPGVPGYMKLRVCCSFFLYVGLLSMVLWDKPHVLVRGWTDRLKSFRWRQNVHFH